MSLNRIVGENVQGLGLGFRVVPLSNWTDTPFWEAATMSAAEAFRKAGALLPISIDAEDVLVQEYPHTLPPRLLFLFHRTIAGRSHYHPHVFELSPATVEDLKLVNRWTDTKH